MLCIGLIRQRLHLRIIIQLMQNYFYQFSIIQNSTLDTFCQIYSKLQKRNKL